MKRNRILTALIILIVTSGFCFIPLAGSQTAQKAKPVFRSVITLQETVNDFQLISNYYPLRSNLDDTGSAVYISAAPTPDEIENAAMSLPSDFFLVSRDKNIIAKVMLINKPVRNYYVTSPLTGEQNEFECNLKGDITENRAHEMVNEKYDTAAKIEGGKLYFNQKELTIIPGKEIKQDVLDLIAKNQLSKSTAANVKATNPEIRALVLSETQRGGKLDFFTPIKGKEYESVKLKSGVLSNNLGVALYKWGRANFNMGVNTAKEAFALFAEFKARELNENEKVHIKMGFESGVKK